MKFKEKFVAEKPKVLVVGIDGATWYWIKPLMLEGKLPTFKKLMENGTSGPLISTIPPMTFPAWAAIASGKKPLKTGAYTSINYDYSVSYVWFKSIKGPFIWDILNERMYTSVIANIPFIRRAYKIKGCMLAGSSCLRRDDIIYPLKLYSLKDLREHIDSLFENLQRIDPLLGRKYPESLDEYIKVIKNRDETLHNIFKFLLTEYAWDFAFVVYEGADAIQHRTWDQSHISQYYEEIDKKINELMKLTQEKYGEDVTIIILSDHGAGPCTRILYLNKWLVKEGYLSLKRNLQTCFDGLANILFKKCGLERTKELIKSKLPKKMVQQIIEKSWLYDLSKLIDWNRTIAFSLGTNFGEIWINLEKRFEKGVVPISKYTKIRHQIAQKLRKIELEDGKVLRLQVYEKIKPNPLKDRSADLIVLIDDKVSNIHPLIDIGTVFGKKRIEFVREAKNDPRESNTHRLEGILLLQGRKVAKGQKICGMVYDITPTILTLYDLPSPTDIDGKPLL